MKDVANKHQRAIARKVMNETCLAARLFGGMDHPTAAALLGVKLHAKCTCATNKPTNRLQGQKLEQIGPDSYILHSPGGYAHD
jgi:hypothetical protein